MGKSCKAAFSLIELLVTIAVIVVLGALAMPVFSRVSSHSEEPQCASNLRQIALAGLQYANDHEGRFRSSRLDNLSTHPTEPGIVDYMGGDAKNKVFTCPAMANYPFSPALGGLRHTYTLSLVATANPAAGGATSDPTKLNSNPLERLIRIGAASRTAWVMDGAWSSSGWFSSAVRYDQRSGFTFPHSGRMNVAYVDGHIGQVKADTPEFNDTSSGFWTGPVTP
jgi:prepilin-type processing-associated H-X9-DG protein/prepilin-type N-terminal cleavage/methylation domain-containing protein